MQKDSLGLPGDNLDLNAVLAIFKKSATVKDFEKNLNSADTKVNNLDLNHDGKVDYLRVVDYGKEDFHSIVIQDPVSSSESQDVAVIEVQKTKKNEAHVQIVGDETLYGKNYIIEPQDKDQRSGSNSGYTDDVYTTPYPVFINAWAWPCVGYIYSPGYVFWASPWYWGYYPGWWDPWAPYGWYYYQQSMIGFTTGYGFYYRRTYVNIMPRAQNLYYGHRSTSGYVQKTSIPTVVSPLNKETGKRSFQQSDQKQIGNTQPGNNNNPVQQKNSSPVNKSISQPVQNKEVLPSLRPINNTNQNRNNNTPMQSNPGHMGWGNTPGGGGQFGGGRRK